MCAIVRTDDGALDDVRSSMNFDIIYKDVTGSTNDDVWDLANHGAHPGVAVRALRQESGRGQWKTRPWVSPEGGLYFSVLLEPRIPEEEFPSMSPRLAEAVARIVRSIAGVTENEIWVKPANDVMCEAGKLCGMSLDAKDGKVVLGVGVNVFHRPQRCRVCLRLGHGGVAFFAVRKCAFKPAFARAIPRCRDAGLAWRY